MKYLLFLAIPILVCACKSTKKPIPESLNIEVSQDIPEEYNADLPFKADATFSLYNTAFGKGKGILVQIKLTKLSAEVEYPRIDSVFLGGKPVKFSLRNEDPPLVEVNLLQNESENGIGANPKEKTISAGNPETRLNPAFLIINFMGQSKRIYVNSFQTTLNKTPE